MSNPTPEPAEKKMSGKRKHGHSGYSSKRLKKEASLGEPMSTDQHHDDVDGDNDGAHTPALRKEQHKHKHKRRPPPQLDDSDVTPLHVIKSKIRSLGRLLRTSERLPADARVAKERELTQYQRDLAEVEARKNRARMISKYHFVRFLERKTATKTLNRLKREKAALEKEEKPDKKKLKRLERNIHIAEVDLNFTIYYPLMKKYVSLFPKQGEDQNEKGDEQQTKTTKTATAEKPRMWSVVERCMAEGTLNDLREDRLDIEDEIKEKPKETSSEKQNSKSESKPKSKTEKKEKKEKTTETITKDDPETQKKSDKKEKKQDKKKDKKEAKKDGKKENKNVKETEDDGDESDGGFFETS